MQSDLYHILDGFYRLIGNHKYGETDYVIDMFHNRDHNHSMALSKFLLKFWFELEISEVSFNMQY